MIRPFTCLCVLLAAVSGLYLYQTKHRTLMLDKQISDTLTQVDAARARTAVLKTEWELLNQPERLTALSARYLNLRPLAPTQFVTLATLERHLPPITAPIAPSSGVTLPAVDGPIAPPHGLLRDETLPIAAATPPEPQTQLAEAAAVLGTTAPGKNIAPAAPAKPALSTRLHPPAAHLWAGQAPTPLAPHHPAALPAAPSADYAYSGAYGGSRPEAMPMAAPRPVASAVLSTAAMHPVGAARPPITTAYAAFEPAYRPTRARGYAASNGGSFLGGGSAALAPPVPVNN